MNDVAQMLTDHFRLTVANGQSLEAMIAAGNYDWVNSDITAERFPITGGGTMQLEPKLFHFDRSISSNAAVETIKATDAENPWEPAKVEHLLSFGATHPDEQRRYPIVALGSVAEVHGGRYVPYLFRVGAERGLNLHWWHGDWRGDYRFLAVRNLSSGA